eukprot:356411-Chlamydomonas_euryale.AAC.5
MALPVCRVPQEAGSSNVLRCSCLILPSSTCGLLQTPAALSAIVQSQDGGPLGRQLVQLNMLDLAALGKGLGWHARHLAERALCLRQKDRLHIRRAQLKRNKAARLRRVAQPMARTDEVWGAWAVALVVDVAAVSCQYIVNVGAGQRPHDVLVAIFAPLELLHFGKASDSATSL